MYFQYIQGLRGIAVLAVFLFHLEILGLGYLGVDIFFVISGFVVFASISKAREANRFSIIEFIRRRIERLLPALLVAVVFVIFISHFLQNVIAREVTTMTGLFSLFGLSNIYTQLASTDYFADSSQSNALLHTWSLSVEAQFYLALPILVALIQVTRIQAKEFRVFTFLGLLSLALLLIGPMVSQFQYLGSLTGYYSPLTRAWQFILGACIYLYLKESLAAPLKRLSGEAKIVTVTFLVGFFIFQQESETREISAIAITFLTGLIILAHSSDTKRNLLLDNIFLRYLGDRSYSIYLIHWPAIVFLRILDFSGPALIALSFILTMILASASYNFLEKPFLSAGRETQKPMGSSRGRKMLLPGIVLYFSVIWISVQPPELESDSIFREANRKPGNYSLGCHDGDSICTFPTTNEEPVKGQPNIILIGDSNAAQYFEGIRQASTSLGRDLKVVTASGCPSFRIRAEDSSKCLQYRDNIEDILRDSPESLVIVGFSQNYVSYSPESESNIDPRSELLGHVEMIESLGHEVIVIEPLPKLERFELASIPPEKITGPFDVKFSIGESNWRFDGKITDYFKRDISSFSAWKNICGEADCLLFDGEKFNFRDDSHISVSFSRELAQDWTNILATSKGYQN